MIRYFIRRLLQAIPVLLAVSLLVFILMQNAGGGPLDLLRQNPRIRPAEIAALERQLGLDRPLAVQYLAWLKGFVTGDWGVGFFTHRSVEALILQNLPRTFTLIGLSLILTLSLALPLGIYSAMRQYSRFDFAATGFSFVGFATPIFVFALLMQLIFAFYLTKWTGIKLFYTSGYTSVGGGGFIDRVQHLTLPVLTLSIASIASWSRYQRASMLDVIRSEYLRTAMSMGIPKRTVIMKHALRNALIPVVTVIALDLPVLFGGAIITETIFAIPGMGRLTFLAIEQRDYPVVMATIMVVAVAVVVFNLLADLIYAVLDPRIRYE